MRSLDYRSNNVRTGARCAFGAHGLNPQDVALLASCLKLPREPKPWKFLGSFITSLYREVGNPKNFQGFGSLGSVANSTQYVAA